MDTNKQGDQEQLTSVFTSQSLKNSWSPYLIDWTGYWKVRHLVLNFTSFCTNFSQDCHLLSRKNQSGQRLQIMSVVTSCQKVCKKWKVWMWIHILGINGHFVPIRQNRASWTDVIKWNYVITFMLIHLDQNVHDFCKCKSSSQNP